MNWRERARKIREAAPGILTKLTEAPFVGFVSTQTARSEIFREAAGTLSPLSPAQEAARSKVLAMLETDPTIHRAFVNRFEGDVMIVTLAVRNVGTCELAIPAERFTGWHLGDYDALAVCLANAEAPN